MSKLNKQKVQNLHKKGGDELLVWRGDSKSRNVYFDDIIYIIKEKSIHNNIWHSQISTKHIHTQIHCKDTRNNVLSPLCLCR
ncbi:hypothetical protein CsSME_00025250 [Camellia sinensis var. sinensis]